MEKKNIMFLIGNGFDIGALSALGAPHLTTYSQFYKYLSFYCLFRFKPLPKRSKAELL